MSIIALSFGIVSLLLTPFSGYYLDGSKTVYLCQVLVGVAIVDIIFSIVGKNKHPKLSIASIIINIIALSLNVLITVAMLS